MINIIATLRDHSTSCRRQKRNEEMIMSLYIKKNFDVVFEK